MEKDNLPPEKDLNDFIRDFYRHCEGEEIPELQKKRFIRRMMWEFLKGVLGYRHDGLKKSRTDRIVQTIRDYNIFPFHIEGIENLENCDLIIGNHQGGQSPDGSKGQAPENVFVYSSVPNSKTKILLKDDLVDGTGKDFMGKLQARGLRNLDPLVFQRLPDLPEDADRRMQAEYAQKTRQEMNRVMDDVFAVIEDGHPVLLYGEGTRSETGAILPFVSTFFDRLFEDHVLPALQNGEDIKIGLLIADTMQTFPEGLSPGRPVLNTPMTLKGVGYTLPSELLQEMQSVSPNFEFDASQKKRFAKKFKAHMHETMKKELAALLVRTLPEGGRLDFLEKRLSEGHSLHKQMSESGLGLSHGVEMSDLSTELIDLQKKIQQEKNSVLDQVSVSG